MDALRAVVALTISLAAMFGTACQMQAWALAPSQRALGIHNVKWLRFTFWRLKDTPVVYWSIRDSHPDRLKTRHHMSEQVAWAWLTLAAFLSVLASAIAVLAAVGLTASSLILGLVLLAYGWACRKNGDENGKLWLQSSAVLVLLSVVLMGAYWLRPVPCRSVDEELSPAWRVSDGWALIRCLPEAAQQR